MTTNGVSSKPLSESQQRAQKIMDPISATLIKVSGATKRRIPDDDARLKMIKQGLVAIGNHINTQVRDRGQDSLEDQLWEFVSEHHWPQSKSNDKRVSGKKLRDMYKKISGKDSAAGPKPSPAKPKAATSDAVATSSANGASAAVKPEATKAETEGSEVKKENATSEVKKDAPETKAEPKAECPIETESSEIKPSETKPSEAKPFETKSETVDATVKDEQ